MFYISDTIIPPYRSNVPLHQFNHPEYGGRAIHRNVGTFQHSTERSPKSRPPIDPIPREPDNFNKVITIHLFTTRDMTGLEAAEMRFLRSVKGYTRLDKIRKAVIRKELEISGIQDVKLKHKQN